jgi:hypothetical protein
MTVGLAAAQANAFLNVYRNTAATAVATPFVQLHTADPGAAGTTAVAGSSTRNAITWNAASGGSMTLSTLGDFTGTTSETITHVSVWTASTAGTFLQSFALTASQAIILNSVLHFSTFTVSFSPIAA